MIAAEQQRADVVNKRKNWRACQRRWNAGQLVFLDETWAKTNMTRGWGWSLRGARLVESVPHGHWQTTTLLCGIRCSGPVAPLVVDGAINGDIFRSWTEQHLIKELNRGDIVVMDNLNSHKVVGIAEAISSVGARVRYLPPYSPDLNPIEQMFAKLKHLIRSAGERVVETLWSRIGKLLDQFDPEECYNYIKHAGYTKK